MAGTPESKVKQKIKGVLKENNVWAYMPVQNGLGVVGIPDFVCCVPLTITQEMVGRTIGVFMGVEAKAPGKEKTTTPNQKMRLAGIHEAGGVAIVASDGDVVNDALKVLKITGVPLYNVP